MKNNSESFKTYKIIPVDVGMDLLVNSVNILNKFKELGFKTRSGFVGVVQDNIEEFKDYKKVSRLLDFWQGRVKSVVLNEQLEGLLEKLKKE